MEKDELSMEELTNATGGIERIPQVNKRIQELTQRIQELLNAENGNEKLKDNKEFQELKEAAQKELQELNQEQMSYNIKNSSLGRR